MANNYRPHFILADGDAVNQFGKMRSMAQRHLVSLRTSTPYRQWQDPAERYILRWGRIVTYLMLDSQAPVAFQLDAARHACRILSVLSIMVPSSWLTAPPLPGSLNRTTPLPVDPTIDPPVPSTKRKSEPDPLVPSCAFFVLFRSNPDLRVFKRWGCLAYVRSEKFQRQKFQQHGEFAVVLGIAGDRYDEWTYEVFLFRTRARVARRDILFREDVMPFAQGRE